MRAAHLITHTEKAMGVVVNRNGNHYYAHRVLFPDGRSFVLNEIKNEARQESYRGVTENGSLANTTSLASETSISQNPPSVKRKNQNREKKFSDAASVFGTTDDFEEAGFIIPSGKMLKFTDERHTGERAYDHRAIGIVYGVNVDLNTNHGFNEASNKYLDEFVESGGIRFDPGSPELDFDAGMQLSKDIPITSAQECTIREFIAWKKQREALYNPKDDPLSLYRGPLAIHIDFGGNADTALFAKAKDLDAWGVKHLTYEGGQINADRIMSDIRYYYETGEARRPSDIARFRYQEREIDNRTLLANALDSVAQNENETKILADYKAKIAAMNAQEQKLAKLKDDIKVAWADVKAARAEGRGKDEIIYYFTTKQATAFYLSINRCRFFFCG